MGPASREHVDATARRRFEKADAQIADLKEQAVQDRKREEDQENAKRVREGIKD
jgi:hypothetical protein